MKYRISVEKINPDAVYSPFGVEIQPPLSEVAAAGLCKALTFRPPKSETNDRAFAKKAHVVRSDKQGTALFIEAEPHVNENAGTLKFTAEGYVAVMIQRIMDPTNSHSFEIHPAK